MWHTYKGVCAFGTSHLQCAAHCHPLHALLFAGCEAVGRRHKSGRLPLCLLISAVRIRLQALQQIASIVEKSSVQRVCRALMGMV